MGVAGRLGRGAGPLSGRDVDNGRLVVVGVDVADTAAVGADLLLHWGRNVGLYGHLLGKMAAEVLDVVVGGIAAAAVVADGIVAAGAGMVDAVVDAVAAAAGHHTLDSLHGFHDHLPFPLRHAPYHHLHHLSHVLPSAHHPALHPVHHHLFHLAAKGTAGVDCHLLAEEASG